jgi:hypothetical protein
MRATITTVLGLSAIITIGCSKKDTGVPEMPPGQVPMDPNDDDPIDDPMDPPGGDPTCVGKFPDGCLANCASPIPMGERCSCEITNCDATEVACRCDAGCYPDQNGNVPADCDIIINPDGTVTVGGELGDALGECASQVSCKEENDLSPYVECGIMDCEVVQPQEVLVDPVSPNVNPNAPSVDPETAPQSSPVSEGANRQPVEVDVLFVVDNSASMGDDQVAAACAIDSFFGAVDAGGGTFRAAVLTSHILSNDTDPTRLSDQPNLPPSNLDATYPCRVQGNTVSCNSAPGLIGIEGTCNQTVSCTCPPANPSAQTLCQFNDQGSWIDSSDPAGRDLLRQLIVQGDLGSWYESGLESAFQYFAELERTGQFDAARPTEIVIIADEDSDANGPSGSYLCPFNTVSRNTAGIPNFNPPAPTNGNTLAQCKQDLINFYGYYFSSRNIVVHGLTFQAGCPVNNTESIGSVYAGVIQRTGGRISSLCNCGAFPAFMEGVGEDTAALSTSICLQSEPVPGTLEVTYTEGGASQPVPENATDGWTYDPARNCIELHGSWTNRFGSYRLDYYDQNAPPTEPTSVGCLAPNTPVALPITLTCGGMVVPQSATNGWTFDAATSCFTFKGAWAESAACETFTLNPVACGFDLADPYVTQIFCYDELVPRSTSEGWSSVSGHEDCIGLYGSWANRACPFTQTPKICPTISGPPPVPDSVGLTCDGAEVPRSDSDGWVYDSASSCFYLYGSYATASCQFAVTYIPSNSGP